MGSSPIDRTNTKGHPTDALLCWYNLMGLEARTKRNGAAFCARPGFSQRPNASGRASMRADLRKSSPTTPRMAKTIEAGFLRGELLTRMDRIMNRLIMLEGLPGTGKTTNSYRLFEQLVRNGRNVRWLHEVSRPHPVLFFSESCFTKEEYRLFKERYPEAAGILDSIAEVRAGTVGIDRLTAAERTPGQEDSAWYKELLKYDVTDLPPERYEPAALEKWEAFVNAALRNDTVYILDSGIFQYQIFTYLLNGADYTRLSGFVHSVMELLMPLEPALIYLYREKTEDSIAFLEKLRGVKDLESIRERDKARPYYRQKQQDVTAFHDFLKDYAAFASGLFDEAECEKLKIEITAQDWALYEARMLRFLGVPRRQAPEYKAEDGTYVNAELRASFTIRDGILTDPEGTLRRLSPKSPKEFFIEGLPELLCFCGDGSVTLCGQQIIPQWSETGRVYTRKKV